MLPNDLTPLQVGELGLQMTIMDEADLIKLAMEHPGRLRAVGLMAAVAAGKIPDDDPEPPKAA